MVPRRRTGTNALGAGTNASERWYVVRTKTRQERTAQYNLEVQGFECLMLEHETVDGKVAPLFRGYVFVRTDGRFRTVNGTRGVKSLIVNAGSPVVVPDEMIDELRSRCYVGNRVRDEHAPKRRLNVGDNVLIGKAGLLQGFIAEIERIDESGSLTVFTQYFGRQIRVQLTGDDLDSID